MERSCDRAERSAVAAQRAAKQIERAARALESAARVGDPAKLRTAAERLRSSITEAQESFDEASTAWSVSDEELSAHLADRYGEELRATAAAAGIRLDHLDDRWTAFPVVVEIAARQRFVRIDGKRTTSLRPTVLTELIRKRQSAGGTKPERFIETLHTAYRTIAKPHGVLLVDIYDVLTILPEAKAGYSRADFARDVHLLAASGLERTKDGAQIDFKGSTGMKGSRDVLTVIPPDGMPRNYYAVTFREAA